MSRPRIPRLWIFLVNHFDQRRLSVIGWWYSGFAFNWLFRPPDLSLARQPSQESFGPKLQSPSNKQPFPSAQTHAVQQDDPCNNGNSIDFRITESQFMHLFAMQTPSFTRHRTKYHCIISPFCWCWIFEKMFRSIWRNSAARGAIAIEWEDAAMLQLLIGRLTYRCY